MKTVRLPRTRTRIPRNDEFRPCTILVPIDFSNLSRGALNKAQQIAQQFGSKLHLIYAVAPIIQPVEYAIVPPEMEEVNQRLLAEQRKRLDLLRQEVVNAGIDCLTEVRLGSAWHAIVDYARRIKCDLIVIPTHGYTGPKHLLMGSTAERVVQHAPCSVLVVR
jgi:universal stress protein A